MSAISELIRCRASANIRQKAGVACDDRRLCHILTHMHEAKYFAPIARHAEGRRIAVFASPGLIARHWRRRRAPSHQAPKPFRDFRRFNAHASSSGWAQEIDGRENVSKPYATEPKLCSAATAIIIGMLGMPMARQGLSHVAKAISITPNRRYIAAGVKS